MTFFDFVSVHSGICLIAVRLCPYYDYNHLLKYVVQIDDNHLLIYGVKIAKVLIAQLIGTSWSYPSFKSSLITIEL